MHGGIPEGGAGECGNTAGNMPTENFLQCIPVEIVLTASWDTGESTESFIEDQAF